jgi:prepilin-type N-terminal cleavage/methylation domain-containing protein
MASRPDGGFTLVELLVVLVLLGLIGVLAFDGLRFGARVWENVDRAGDGQGGLRRGHEGFRRAITALVSLPGEAGGAAGGLQGNERELAFLAQDGQGLVGHVIAIEGEGEGGVEGAALVLHRKPAYAGGEAGRDVLMPEAAGLTLAYRADGMAPGRWASHWQADWPLPDLIAVRGKMEAVVRISLSHPSACRVAPRDLGCDR